MRESGSGGGRVRGDCFESLEKLIDVGLAEQPSGLSDVRSVKGQNGQREWRLRLCGKEAARRVFDVQVESGCRRGEWSHGTENGRCLNFQTANPAYRQNLQDQDTSPAVALAIAMCLQTLGRAPMVARIDVKRPFPFHDPTFRQTPYRDQILISNP